MTLSVMFCIIFIAYNCAFPSPNYPFNGCVKQLNNINFPTPNRKLSPKSYLSGIVYYIRKLCKDFCLLRFLRKAPKLKKREKI